MILKAENSQKTLFSPSFSVFFLLEFPLTFAKPHKTAALVEFLSCSHVSSLFQLKYKMCFVPLKSFLVSSVFQLTT